MRLHPVRTIFGALALAFAFGFGCGGTTSGCGLTALPSMPPPRGFPSDQQIEGGGQVRITAPGFQKISALISQVAKQQLMNPATCFGPYKQDLVIDSVRECNQACNGGQGCPVNVTLRPDLAPPDGIELSLAQGNNPVMHIETAFDIDVPIEIDNNLAGTGWSNVCTMHATSLGTQLGADIALSIEPVTGDLQIALQNVTNLQINLGFSNCGFLSEFLNAVSGVVDAIANLLGPTLANLLKGPLSTLIQGFVPSPPGLAGVMPIGKSLASLGAPKDAALEMYLVAGGYVSGYNGGLNIGLITGMNSDRDPSTRGPGMTHDPSLCVPARPTYDLGKAPWNLPLNAPRRDFLLDVAPEFAGMPDPMDQMGNTKDLAIGLSKTFLNLAGFHVYNSGTLCLAIGGDTLAQLNAGAISVLVPSLSNILENRKGPVAIILRPEQPLTFTLGSGAPGPNPPADPLIKVGVADLRLDFYVFLEERYVRIFTLALDMNVGIDLAITTDMMGNPQIQPMVTGIDKTSVTARVTNSDLLQEDPAKLQMTLLSLIDIAVGQLMGAIKPFPLPAFSGFALDGLEITRVQTKQDDFLAIYSSLMAAPNPKRPPLPKWIPRKRELRPVETSAVVAKVLAPSASTIRESVLAGNFSPGRVPAVELELGGSSAGLEWQWRVDKSGWSPWTTEARPQIADKNFLLQGHHLMEVRARVQGDWLTEDQTPVELPILIDSVPPELHPTVAQGQFQLGGWDNVTDDDKIVYAVQQADGSFAKPAARAQLTLDEAWAASGGGTRPLTVKATDEAGNSTLGSFDLNGWEEFHGRSTTASSGCGCSLGAKPTRGAWALSALFPFGVLLLRRRWLHRASAQHPRKRGRGAFAALIAVALVSSLHAGCNCGGANSLPCTVDDDCRAQKCDPGEIPACISGMCGCNPDLYIGDIGRFSTLAMRGSTAYVAAYNTTYGDLMIGHITGAGKISNWEFVDGIPDGAVPESPLSQVRGGVMDPGDDVGRYTSIAIQKSGDPEVAYYDQTHASLKFASFGAVRWHTHTVDKATGTPGKGGDDFGRYASMTLDPNGNPGIAYYAEVTKGASGMRESQLRFAQAKTPFPSASSDWTITTVETRPMPVLGAPTPVLPEGIALFVSSARKMDGAPVCAYYDRERGNLRYVEYDAVAKSWGMAQILDGEDAMGNDTADVGWYPSVTVAGGISHISYEDATLDNLLYVNSMTKTPEVVDDGYHPDDETTLDGLPAPVYHLVGDSSSIQVASDGTILVAYQDSTVVTLNLAIKDPKTNMWARQVIAGHATMPFKGSYGFYAQNRVTGGIAVLSSYAIDQHEPNLPLFWVEIFSVNLGTIM